ncbi:hypothetical protein SCLCIDRAFT_1212009, partial [Scleroderma citrinum Foug A]
MKNHSASPNFQGSGKAATHQSQTFEFVIYSSENVERDAEQSKYLAGSTLQWAVACVARSQRLS